MLTALYAAILGLIQVALTANVIKGRFKYKLAIGSGGQEDMERRIRVHGNFIETVPMALLLLMFSEMQILPITAVHVLGVTLVCARLMHAAGMASANHPQMLRAAGMVLTLLVILVCSLWLLYQVTPAVF